MLSQKGPAPSPVFAILVAVEESNQLLHLGLNNARVLPALSSAVAKVYTARCACKKSFLEARRSVPRIGLNIAHVGNHVGL